MAEHAWLAVARIAEIGGPALRAMRVRLSPADRRRAARFKSPRRRREFLAGRWLVAESRRAWRGNPRARASIAHSGGWVACLLARSATPGVDVEPMTERDFAKLGAWTFGADWLREGADLRAGFYRRWTGYEARLKAGGGTTFCWQGNGVALAACLASPRAPAIRRWRQRLGFTRWVLPRVAAAPG